MADCLYTTFDIMIHKIKPLPKNKLKEAVKIAQEYSLIDLIDFCAENNCYPENWKNTLFDFMIMFEDLEASYWEEDREKYLNFLESIGVTEEVFRKYVS